MVGFGRTVFLSMENNWCLSSAKLPTILNLLRNTSLLLIRFVATYAYVRLTSLNRRASSCSYLQDGDINGFSEGGSSSGRYLVRS